MKAPLSIAIMAAALLVASSGLSSAWAQDADGEGEAVVPEGTDLQEELSGGGGSESGSLRRSNRMEFDERLVKGQVARSGAVYLFKRVPRNLPGLVAMRRSYRERIVLPVLGKRKLKPVTYSKKKDSTQTTEEAPAEAEGGSQ